MAAALAVIALVFIPFLVLRMGANQHPTGDLARVRLASEVASNPADSGPSEAQAPKAAVPPELVASGTAREAKPGETAVSYGDTASKNEEAERGRAASGERAAEAKDADSASAASERRAEPTEAAAAPATSARETAARDRKAEPAAKESSGVARADASADRESRQAKPSSEPPLPKIEASKALKLPEEAKADEVRVLKGGSVREDFRAKEKTGAIKSQDAPPADTSSEPTAPRRLAAQPGSRLAAGRTSDDASRSAGPPAAAGKPEKAERRIEGKRFRLVNGVWVDRSYKAEGTMAAVTVAKDSDVYNQLIARESGLKVYLSHFGPEERAVIVYKKIAYKLIPKEAKN
jgi:hypothetical protein